MKARDVAPVADHPLLSSGAIWAAGAGTGAMALVSGFGLQALVAGGVAYLVAAAVSAWVAVRTGQVRTWALREPWRSQVQEVAGSWNRHLALLDRMGGSGIGGRLRSQHEDLTAVLCDAWRIAQWGSAHQSSVSESAELRESLKVAYHELVELAEGMADVVGEATRLAAASERPTTVGTERVEHLREAALAYREALSELQEPGG